jgi:hypothetical protein
MNAPQSTSGNSAVTKQTGLGRCASSTHFAVRESGIDGDPRDGVILGQIVQERWRVGVHNGQLERRVFPGESIVHSKNPLLQSRSLK